MSSLFVEKSPRSKLSWLSTSVAWKNLVRFREIALLLFQSDYFKDVLMNPRFWNNKNIQWLLETNLYISPVWTALGLSSHHDIAWKLEMDGLVHSKNSQQTKHTHIATRLNKILVHFSWMKRSQKLLRRIIFILMNKSHCFTQLRIFY